MTGIKVIDVCNEIRSKGYAHIEPGPPLNQ